LADLIAGHIGHDRTLGGVAAGSVLAAGTMQQLRDAIVEVVDAAGGDNAIVATVVVPGENNLTPKGNLVGWMRRARQFGALLAVLTSDDRAPTCFDLEKAAANTLIDDLIAGDDGYPPKPDPTSLLVLADRLGVEPSRTVMIGDSPTDMAAALAAGTQRIGVRARSGEAPAGAQAVVVSLDEIRLAP
jgi:phosphoglycolate phosphatase-like HAD superfamily hydrolase